MLLYFASRGQDGISAGYFAKQVAVVLENCAYHHLSGCYCVLPFGSVAYDWWATELTRNIIEFQIHNPNLGDTATTDLMKQGQETAHQHGVTLFELFTHVLTGFLGIAIAALADVVGMKVGVDSALKADPAAEVPAK